MLEIIMGFFSLVHMCFMFAAKEFFVFSCYFRLHDSLEASNLDIRNLTVCFFILNFCAATQDIAVDGWALTMLPEKNVGLASTCNSVGQVRGNPSF